MTDESDPAVRAIRARFEQISAALTDSLERSRATYESDLSQLDQRDRPEPRRRHPQPDDPSDTGVFSASWMRNQ
ncbi:hypothetical protein [Actinokineospora enzanensis]|uniref:hypothetical protein n=1 Tax=Actinokineospora enzanensis TaxID=155975 RepID=UPI000381D2C9|nr:hypothetical protein [Actinokineospora enzanensis]